MNGVNLVNGLPVVLPYIDAENKILLYALDTDTVRKCAH